jgi:hypothetical protein
MVHVCILKVEMSPSFGLFKRDFDSRFSSQRLLIRFFRVRKPSNKAKTLDCYHAFLRAFALFASRQALERKNAAMWELRI